MALTKVKASNISLTTAAASSNDTTPATTQYVTTAINNLIDGAPATLNTLDEIAAALNDDAALNTTLTNAIAAKLPLAGGTMTGGLTINHSGGIVTKGGGGLNLHPTDAHDTDAWILYQYSDNTLRYNFTGAGADEIIIKHPASANTTTLTVDTAQVRVGIGTGGPEYPLHVQGSNITSGGGIATVGIYDSGTPYNGTQPGGGITFRGKYNSNGNITNFGTIQAFKENGADGDYASSLILTTRSNGGNLTEKLRIASNGNVGIGTGINADELLHLEKSAGTTLVKTEVAANSIVGFEIAKTGPTTQSWRIVDGQTVNGRLEIYDVTDSRTVMMFDGDGNIGIGVTPTSGVGLPLQIKSTVGYVGLRLDGTGSASVWDLYSSYSGGVGFFGVYDRAAANYKLVATRGGPVGIGIETPGTFDSRANNLVVRDTGDGGITIVSGDSSDARIAFTIAADTGLSNGQIHYDNSNDYMKFATGGSDRVAIDNNGKVGIGIFSNMDRDLHIKGSGSDVGIQIEKTGAGELRVAYDSTGPYLYAENTNHGIRMYVGGTEKFNLPPSGRLSVGSQNAATGKRGLRVGRTIYNWFNYGRNDGNTYLHIKTNMLNTSSNTQPTMSMFHIKGYTYSAESIDSMLGFHNWSGTYHNAVYTNNGTRTVVSSSYAPYTSSDNYVVLVLSLGNNYPGISIDFHQAFEYTFLDVDVTAYSKSNSTSGVY